MHAVLIFAGRGFLEVVLGVRFARFGLWNFMHDMHAGCMGGFFEKKCYKERMDGVGLASRVMVQTYRCAKCTAYLDSI
jgi:hypothetical protein